MRHSKRYSFTDKIKPFVRGLNMWHPLVEVALEGLKNGNITDKKARKYAKRITEYGNHQRNLREIDEALERDYPAAAISVTEHPYRGLGERRDHMERGYRVLRKARSTLLFWSGKLYSD